MIMKARIEALLPLILGLGALGCGEKSSEPLGSAAQAQAAATLRVGPELPVDDPAYAPYGRHWTSYGIAWNGTAYLVVANGYIPNAVVSESLGWRLNASAQPLDPLPFALPGSGPVASNGSDYLMAYLDRSNSSVRAARISSAGVVLDPSGISLSATGFSRGAAWPEQAVASNGSDYLAVWTDRGSGNNDIYGARINASGQVLDANGFAISSGAGSETQPAVAWDGGRYVVAWVDSRSGAAEVFLAHVTSAGTVVEPAGLRIAPGSSPAIASDGTISLVVWNISLRDPSVSGVFGARVARDGSVLGAPFAIKTGRVVAPSVAWTGTSFVTYYTVDPCRVMAASVQQSVRRRKRSGSLCQRLRRLHHPGRSRQRRDRTARVGRSKGRYPEIYRVLTATAYSSDRTSLGSWNASSANFQLYPQIAHDANRYFVAWHDLRATDRSDEVYPVYGARVGADWNDTGQVGTIDRSIRHLSGGFNYQVSVDIFGCVEWFELSRSFDTKRASVSHRKRRLSVRDRSVHQPPRRGVASLAWK